MLNQEYQYQQVQITRVILKANYFFLQKWFLVIFLVKILWVMYRKMHIWCCNIKNYKIKHSQNKRYDHFQIDGQAFTSPYLPMYLQSPPGQTSQRTSSSQSPCLHFLIIRGLLSCSLSLGKLGGCECLLFSRISLKNELYVLRTNM